MFDVGAACQTFCLAAWEQGLGTVIMGIFDEGRHIRAPADSRGAGTGGADRSWMA